MTSCERAFVSHMREVCPLLADPKEYSDEFICRTYFEALVDWTAGVRWGQMNPGLVP